MECLYSKYNRHRLPGFQIETSICREDGKLFVVKKALTAEARAHIQDIKRNQARLAEHIVDGSMRLPKILQAEHDSISYEFIRGTSFDQMLFQSYLDRDADRFNQLLDDYAHRLKSSFKTTGHLLVTQQLKKVFGLGDAVSLDPNQPCFQLPFIDPVFENVMLAGDGCYLIDAEWVFDGSLPVSFVLFRSIFYFYKVKYEDFDMDGFVPWQKTLERFGLNSEIVKQYEEMDKRFQFYVFGHERYYNYKNQYVKQVQSIPLLEETIEHQRDIVRQMHEQILVFKKTIASNLLSIKEQNQLIAKKDRKLDEIINSRGWKFLNSLRRMLRKIFPPHSWRSRLAQRLGIKP